MTRAEGRMHATFSTGFRFIPHTTPQKAGLETRDLMFSFMRTDIRQIRTKP
jgi:hypothetical protein